MRYKTLQCFLAALIMIAFLAPSAYASGAPDTYEASANAVSEKYIGKTVPGACVVISEHDNRVTSMTFRLAHDYVPAGPLNGFAGSFLSLGSYILLTVLLACHFDRIGLKDRLQSAALFNGKGLYFPYVGSFSARRGLPECFIGFLFTQLFRRN